VYKYTLLGVAGRNIHALDPYRMPSQAALERGAAAAKGILKAHRDANHGTYPQTVAVSFRHTHTRCTQISSCTHANNDTYSEHVAVLFILSVLLLCNCQVREGSWKAAACLLRLRLAGHNMSSHDILLIH